MSKFKVGDKVRVIKEPSISYVPIGHILEVDEVEYSDKWSFRTKQDDSDIDTYFFWFTKDIDCFELVDEPKFKVGDRVRIVHRWSVDSSEHKGRLGTILDFISHEDFISGQDNPNGNLWKVDMDSQEYNIAVWEEEIELVEEPKMLDGSNACTLPVGTYSVAFDEITERQLYENVFGNSLKELKNNDAPCASQNKTRGIMSKISSFVKNLALSEDEKLLRKYGLKDECGEYTCEAKDLVIQKLIGDNNAYLVEVAKGLEAEESKK